MNWLFPSKPMPPVQPPPSAVPPYMEGFLAFAFLVWGFELYLDMRQRKQLLVRDIPQTLKSIMSSQEFEASRQYSLDKNSFKMLEEAAGTFKTLLFYVMGGLPFMWSIAVFLTEGLGIDPKSNEISLSMVFFLLFMTKETIESVPWELYREFVLEERHGFNKQALSLFISDQVTTLLLVACLGSPALGVLIWIIKAGGTYFYLYAWGLCSALIFVFLTIYPNLIAPLFNKFTALHDGPLKTAIEQLARQNEFPLKKLYVVDGSTRSSHSNAYFFGFGSNKRIVLFDTLSKTLLSPENKEHDPKEGQGCSIEEIVAILGHELGHWKLWHTVCNLAIVQGHLLCFFFFLGGMLGSSAMYQSFGFSNEKAVIIGLILFSNIISPFEHLIQFCMNLLSRRFEYQADKFAVDQGRGEALKAGLIKISRENKSNANPDWLYSAYHHTHPALVERLDAISREIKVKRE